MDYLSKGYLLNAILEKKGQMRISVKGISMQPLLHENDNITIRKHDHYQVGDIVLYPYKNDGLLVHRLLKIDNRFYCKGDNAFRIEDIEERDILGKVVLVNGKPLCEWPEWKISLSYKIGRLFRTNGYNRDATMQSGIYKAYSDIVLNNAVDQKYYLNSSIIKEDAFPNKIEIDIVNMLTQPCSVSEIAEKLQTTYDRSEDSFRCEIEKNIGRFVLDEIIVPL